MSESQATPTLDAVYCPRTGRIGATLYQLWVDGDHPPIGQRVNAAPRDGGDVVELEVFKIIRRRRRPQLRTLVIGRLVGAP